MLSCDLRDRSSSNANVLTLYVYIQWLSAFEERISS
jgi:hypothetical protein